MSAAVDIRHELSRHAWRLLKYLQKHAVNGVLPPFRVEHWADHEGSIESLNELLDCGALVIDELDRYVLAGDAT